MGRDQFLGELPSSRRSGFSHRGETRGAGPIRRPGLALPLPAHIEPRGNPADPRSATGEPRGHDRARRDGSRPLSRVDWPLRSDRFHVFAYTAAPLPMFPLPSSRWRVFLPEVPDRSIAERQSPNMEEIERPVAQRAGSSRSSPNTNRRPRCSTPTKTNACRSPPACSRSPTRW